MGKEVSDREGAAAGGDGKTYQCITAKKLDTLLRKDSAARNVISGEQETLATAVKKAIDNDHLHKKSWGWIKQLNRMDQAQRDEQLYHFHHMCELRGWPGQSLPLSDRAEPEPEADEPEAEPDNGAERLRGLKPVETVGHAPEKLSEFGDPGAGNGMIPPRSIKPDDGSVRDLRPRHLRTGSVDPEPAPAGKPH